jgi:hypothetical protein
MSLNGFGGRALAPGGNNNASAPPTTRSTFVESQVMPSGIVSSVAKIQSSFVPLLTFQSGGPG